MATRRISIDVSGGRGPTGAQGFSPARDVRDFGAVCDAVNVRTGLRIAANSNIAQLTAPLPLNCVDKLIVITGAGFEGGTLATTIGAISSDGLTLTLRDNALTATPIYVMTKVNQVADGGDNYVVGEVLTLNTGDQVIVERIVDDAPSGPIITNILGGVQGALPQTQTIHATQPANPATQTATTGNGSGATFTLKYGSTGQFWYGTDDGAAINAAIASDDNIYFPVLSASMTTIPIMLSLNQTSLLGGDYNSSIIVAAAEMDNLVVRPLNQANASVTGGTVRDIYFEGYKLVQQTLNVLGGEGQSFQNVSCAHGINAHFSAGVPHGEGIQIVQSVFDHIRAVDDFNQFPLVSSLANYGFFIDETCNANVFTNLWIHGGVIAIKDQATYNYYGAPLVQNAPPYNVTYGMELSGSQNIVGARIINASLAAIHAIGGITLFGLRASFGRTVIQLGVTAAVLIESNVQNVQIFGVNANGHVADDYDGPLPADQVIVQLGTPGAGSSIFGNGGASYNVPPIGTRIPQTANFRFTNNAFDWPVDATSGNRVATVPGHQFYDGTTWRCRKVDASSNTVTVAMSGSDTLNGLGSIVLTNQDNYVEFQNVVDSNGLATSAWTIVGSVPVYVDPSTLDVLATGSTTPRTFAARFAEEINVLDFYGSDVSLSDRDAMRAAIAQAAIVSAAGGCPAIRIPAGAYAWDDGDIMNGTQIAFSDFSILGSGPSTSVSVDEVGANNGRLFDVTGSRFFIGDFNVTYSAALPFTDPTSSIIRNNGCADYLYRNMRATNAPNLLLDGDTSGVHRGTYEKLSVGAWRCDLGGDFIQIQSGTNGKFLGCKMDASLNQNGAIARFRPRGTTASGNGIDTWVFEASQFQNVGTGSGELGWDMDCTAGDIFNIWCTDSVFDHEGLTSIRIFSDVGGTGQFRHFRHSNSRSSADQGTNVLIDWSGTGTYMNVEFGGSNFLYRQGPPIDMKGSRPGHFERTVFRGVSFTSTVTGSTPNPSSVIRAAAGMDFAVLDSDFTLYESNNTPPLYVVETLGAVDYLFVNNRNKAAINTTFKHGAGDVPSPNRIITNNQGMTEDTVQAATIAALASVSSYNPATVAFLARVANQPSAYRTLYDNFITALVNAGIWPAMKAIYMIGMNDEATSFQNLVSASGALTEFGTGDGWIQNRGWTGNGTDRYLESGLTSAGLGLGQNDIAMMVFVGTDVAANAQFDLANSGGTVAIARINPRVVGSHFQTRCNNFTDAQTAASASSIGSFGMLRNSGSGYNKYIDGAVVSSPSDASTGVPTGTYRFGNQGFTFSTRQVWGGFIADASIGDAGMLLVSQQFKIVQAAVGAPV